MRFLRAWGRAYTTIDPRSLAAGRIALALALLLDLGKRAAELATWYSNDGLLPNHTLLWRPTYRWVFSFFYMASSPGEAALGFAACALAYLMLLVGYRTRLAQVASVVCLLSLHGRVLFVQNGGDVVLGELGLWTTFLPLGRRWSMDATLARLRGEDPAPRAAPVVSLAAAAVLLQLALIYLFNAVHKSGVTWRSGTAVHYVLVQSHIVTRLGLWAGQHLGVSASRALTWSALGAESLLPALLLWPIGLVWTRRAAVLLIWALHIGFALFLNLGVFVPAMLAFTPLLVPARDWDTLEGRVRVPARARAAWERLAQGLRWLDPPAGGTPLGRAMARHLPLARELLVAAVMIVALSQILVENAAIRRVARIHQPRALEAAVTYLQLFQGWSMFAPDVPTSESNISVDAVTADGRHVDPLSERASPEQPQPGGSIPPRLDHNSYFFDYISRIAGCPEYHQAFVEWVLRYPERTGRPEDRLTSFRSFIVERDTPAPGAHTPGPAHTRPFVHFP